MFSLPRIVFQILTIHKPHQAAIESGLNQSCFNQVRDDDVTLMMTIRLKLNWIDSRITLPASHKQPQNKKSSKPIPLNFAQRNNIWMPNFASTFRTKIMSDYFRTESDFVTLSTTKSNETKVQVQVVLKLSEPCPKMNFKVRFF